MEIRGRCDDDLAALVAVAARVHESDGYPIHLPGESYIQFLESPPPLAAWVAVDDTRLVGHIALNDTTSQSVMDAVNEQAWASAPAYIARLLVDPNERRRGIARQLLEHAYDFALGLGRSVYLDVVDAPLAAPAIALYERSGWTRVGRVSFDLAGELVHEVVFSAPGNPQGAF